ncbi:hypothetical protein DFH08DRAFT_483697 [Mycena albidolilacea]|uniref:Uncharacterized protein n=1 Tax=Mycena albidolilacea TaxID=1033008 RepID=A0AAD7EBF9_9AGAR|nr:hypothetical protein DFH08DRAFT_483697 [Mycena albidolilacea]
MPMDTSQSRIASLMSWLAVLTPMTPFPGRRGHVPHAGVCSLLDPPRLVPVASALSQALPCRGMKFASPLHLSAQTPPPTLQATTSPIHAKCECPCTGYDHHQLCRSTHARWMDATSLRCPSHACGPAPVLRVCQYFFRRLPIARLRTDSREFPFRLSSTHPSSTPASWTRGLAAYHAVRWWLLSSRTLPANASSPNPPPCSDRGHPLTAIHLHFPPPAIRECQALVHLGIASCSAQDRRTPAELARSHADKYVLRACIVEPAPVYHVPMGVLPALHISAPSSAYPSR